MTPPEEEAQFSQLGLKKVQNALQSLRQGGGGAAAPADTEGAGGAAAPAGGDRKAGPGENIWTIVWYSIV